MKNKKVYMVISVIIITILSIFIILALKGIYGNSSKQIKESYKFLHDLQKVNAIDKGQSIDIKDFQEIKRISEFSNVKYTLVNNNYVTELDEGYNVIGFFEQSVNKVYNVEKLTEEECIEYANKYLNSICEDEISITVEDNGIGIENLEEAREPLYTSKPELERSGMGFTVMETFMDSLEVYSEKDKGTKIIMKKKMNT